MTRELMSWPDSVAWQWRASVAEVAQSGPFSCFAGVQRWFAVLEGDGVCLTVDSHLNRLTKSDQPLAFDGVAQTTCELLGGATQDFNLMVQDGTSACLLRVNGSFQTIADAPKIIAAYAHKEKAQVQIGNEIYELSPDSFGWTRVEAGVVIHIHAANVLLMEIDV